MTKKFVSFILSENHVTRKPKINPSVLDYLNITVTGEIKDWCKIWTTGHWFLTVKTVNNKVSLIINFTQSEDAMAFKLTFL